MTIVGIVKLTIVKRFWSGGQHGSLLFQRAYVTSLQ